MFAGPGADTLRGQSMLRDTAAGSQQGLNGAYSYTNNLINRGGFADGMGGDIAEMDNVGNAYGGIGDSLGGPSNTETAYDQMQGGLRGPSAAETGFGGLYRGAGGPSLTEQRFGNDTYGTNSDAYRKLRSKLSDDVTTQNLSAFNSSGLFGSDGNRESLAEGLGTALAGADMEQMRYGDALERGDVAAIEGQRGRSFSERMSSLGAGDAARLAQINTRAGLLGAGDQSRSNRLAQRMAALSGRAGAATGAFGMRQGGIDNAMGAAGTLGARYADMLRPGETMQGVGEGVDAARQGALLGRADLHDRGKNANYNRFLELLGGFTGSQANAGMEEQVPWWQQALGFGGQVLGSALR